MIMHTRLGFLLAGCLAFSACDSEDDGAGGDAAADDGAADDAAADDAAADDAPSEDDGTEEALSFATDIAPILSASCSCHSGAAPSAGLDLSAEGAFAALVEVASSAGAAFVAPGDSSASYLVNKLDGSQADVGGGGARMPMGGQLADADTDKIVDWIDAGALP